jgi:WD40 repeat protein
MIIDSGSNVTNESKKPIEKLDLNGKLNFKEIFNTRSSIKELTGHKKRVYCLDWNQNGSKLASGSVDCSIRVNFLKIIKFSIFIIHIRYGL